jgi:hypothetical protein
VKNISFTTSFKGKNQQQLNRLQTVLESASSDEIELKKALASRAGGKVKTEAVNPLSQPFTPPPPKEKEREPEVSEPFPPDDAGTTSTVVFDPLNRNTWFGGQERPTTQAQSTPSKKVPMTERHAVSPGTVNYWKS